MNEMGVNFSLAVGEFMINIHLRQLGFTYSVYRPFY